MLPGVLGCPPIQTPWNPPLAKGDWGLDQEVESECADGTGPNVALVENAFVEQLDEFLIAHAQDLLINVFVVLSQAWSGHTRLAGRLG